MKLNFSHIAKFLVVLFAGTVLASCVSTRSVTIEIPEKVKKDLPANIQSLVIISRVLNNEFNDTNTDTLQRVFYKQGFDYDTVINDFSAIDTTIKVLGDLLFESGRYDIVIPEDRLVQNQNSLPMASEMSQNEVKEWCDTFKTDGVLSIDYFKTRVMTSYEKMVNFDPYTNQFADFVHAKMQVKYEVLFRVYDPLKQGAIFRRILQDTLTWEGSDRTTTDLFYRFTPVKQALKEAGIAAALDFSAEISPVWRKENRRYFATGDENMKKAALLVESNQWDEAIKLWKNTAENARSTSLKSKAEFNLAVASELSGDIDSAISWGLKSFENMFRTITYEYLETLKNRKTELQNQ